MVTVKHIPIRLEPDRSRLVAQPFIPGSSNFAGEANRVDAIAKRLLTVEPDEADRLLADMRDLHADWFADLDATWLRHFELVRNLSPVLADIADERTRYLVGAGFTQAYAYQGAALTNPSIVPLGDGADGSQPFVLSLRAIGEGHRSSIAFVTGAVTDQGDVTLDQGHPHVSNGQRHAPEYSKAAFIGKLEELGLISHAMTKILALLPERFDTDALAVACSNVRDTDAAPIEIEDSIKRIHWLADSNYQLSFDSDLPISEHLISPAAPAESHGLEDARFVRFRDDDGSVRYLATYTAYDGVRILPQLIETADFHRFRMATMTGPAVHHKGMAIFPRKVNGDFVALSRHDNERLFILRSGDVRRWSNAEVLLEPERTWEIIQTGNCGSPIETERGWVVITHGVGPMRRYTLGAILLDLDDPSRVIGKTAQPLIEPRETDLFGYVPNVVYSCGSMAHNGLLIVPHGYADYGVEFAVITMSDVLDALS